MEAARVGAITIHVHHGPNKSQWLIRNGDHLVKPEQRLNTWTTRQLLDLADAVQQALSYRTPAAQDKERE